MLEDPGAPPRGQPPRGDPARLTPGSPAPGQALRLGLATQRFRERDDLPLAPGVRHGRFGRWAAGAGRARRGGRVRGGIREARGRTPGRPCALARAHDRARVLHRRGSPARHRHHGRGVAGDRAARGGPAGEGASHAAARRADRRRHARGAAGTRLRPAARHGSRRSGAGADPRLVAARARGGERGGVGEVRGGSERAGQPSLTSSNLPRPSPISPLFGISAFYLLRMPDTLIILRSQELGVPVAIVPLLWAAVHVVRSSSSFLGGAASDRLGPGQTMWVGWLVYAMLAVGMARAGTAAAAWGLFLALGLVAGLTESPERALVARLAGTHQGSGFGLYHGITGFAA